MSDPVTQTPAPTTSPSQSTTPAKPRRRWVKVLAALFVLLLLGAWFAPTVIAKTGLRNRLARQAAADLNGSLDIGSASLGWFSPVELRDVTLADSQGRVVARIPKITSSKTLLALVRDRSALGEFALDRPTIEVICEKKTTNLEDALRKYLQDDGTPRGATRPEVTVKVTSGTLTFRDAENGQASEFTDLTRSFPCQRRGPIPSRRKSPPMHPASSKPTSSRARRAA